MDSKIVMHNLQHMARYGWRELTTAGNKLIVANEKVGRASLYAIANLETETVSAARNLPKKRWIAVYEKEECFLGLEVGVLLRLFQNSRITAREVEEKLETHPKIVLEVRDEKIVADLKLIETNSVLKSTIEDRGLDSMDPIRLPDLPHLTPESIRNWLAYLRGERPNGSVDSLKNDFELGVYLNDPAYEREVVMALLKYQRSADNPLRDLSDALLEYLLKLHMNPDFTIQILPLPDFNSIFQEGGERKGHWFRRINELKIPISAFQFKVSDSVELAELLTQNLPKDAELTYLNLSREFASDASVERIVQSFPQLETLILWGIRRRDPDGYVICELTDLAGDYLVRLKRLTHLEIEQTDHDISSSYFTDVLRLPLKNTRPSKFEKFSDEEFGLFGPTENEIYRKRKFANREPQLFGGPEDPW